VRFDLECIRAARVLGASSLGREKNVVRFQRLGGEWNTEDLDMGKPQSHGAFWKMMEPG